MMGWDVIIVGAGLAGAAAARRLAEMGRQVLIVEQGVARTDPPGEHLRNLAPLRDNPDALFPAIDDCVDYLDVHAPPESLPGAFTTSFFGGMGVLWTNNCPRAVAGVDLPDLLSEEEWDRRYRTAEHALQVSDGQFEDSLRQRAVSNRLRAALTTQGRSIVSLPLSGTRGEDDQVHFVGPSDVLAPVRDRFQLLEGRVEEILLDAVKVVGVLVGGVIHRGRNVVVAAGAIETPALLWRSGLRSRALGRYLSYHPVLIGQIVLDAELCAPGSDPDPVPRLGIPPTVQRPWFTMLLRDTNPLPVAPRDRDVSPNRLIEVQAFAPVDPNIDNVMTFGAGGSIGFDVPLRDDDEDRRRSIESDADELSARLGRYREGCRPQWAPLGTPHLMGSCRMGRVDDGSSVADQHGEVWGTDGVYLATNGLIPNRLAVNPTLTTCAMAMRTTEAILANGTN
ncbi:MAG: FAD-dependent oxidoreductase [Ornithinimicrobium sp.]